MESEGAVLGPDDDDEDGPDSQPHDPRVIVTKGSPWAIDRGRRERWSAPAFAAKRAGSYRAQLVLRGDHPTAVLDRVDVGAEWTVDVDPMTLLG